MANKLFPFPLAYTPAGGDQIDPSLHHTGKVTHPDSSLAGSRKPVERDKHVVV